MQHTKVSYELIQNYISSSRDTEKDSPDPASAIENRLMREIVRENLTKRQKCYIIMYYTKGMTMQERVFQNPQYPGLSGLQESGYPAA